MHSILITFVYVKIMDSKHWWVSLACPVLIIFVLWVCAT